MPSHAHSRLLLQLLLQAAQRLRLLADEGVAAVAALGRHRQLRAVQGGEIRYDGSWWWQGGTRTSPPAGGCVITWQIGDEVVM